MHRKSILTLKFENVYDALNLMAHSKILVITETKISTSITTSRKLPSFSESYLYQMVIWFTRFRSQD